MAIPLNSTRMLLRFKPFRIFPTACARHLCTSKSSLERGGKNEDAGATDKNQQNPSQSQEAKEKLKTLLGSMNAIPAVSMESRIKLSRPNLKNKFHGSEKRKARKGNDIMDAVNKVADTLPQDREKTRRDLITKLKTLKTGVAEAVANWSGSTLSSERIADGTGLETDINDFTEEIPQQKFANIKELNQIVGSMKVEDQKMKPMFLSLKSLSSENMPLGIFKNARFSPQSDAVKLTTWEMLKERELRLCIQSPANGFEQMIRWTEQGKLWRFPINNEQGMEEEAKVGFHEHIFLEQHLEPWCPPRGPVRHFMELVCVGLSKNPYLTVSQKKDHINWFRNYFEAKRSILEESGALGERANSLNAPST